MPHIPGHSDYDWGRDTWLGDPDYTLAEQWNQIAGRQAPFWETRAPMAQMGQRLMGQYLLGAPEYALGTDADPTLAGFAAPFMGGATPAQDWRAGSYANMLARARAAAASIGTPLGDYMGGFVPGSDAWNTAAWYGGQFNPEGAGSDRAAAANQLLAATALAQQRQGTGSGTWGGAMGQAISNAMQAQQRYRQSVGDPTASFLAWYLSQIPEQT
jgi:hypothetical protein